jgi:nucleoside-diphosphate-sugar epimerase
MMPTADANDLIGARVIVLGGSVFVGKHLVSALAARGAAVSVLNRGHTPAVFPAGVERLTADRTNPTQMRDVLAGRDWDAVFDVSGFVMAAGGSDIEGLLELLDGHTAAYVYTSSIMAYDQSWLGVFPWTEDQPTNPDGPSTYGGFKAVAESAIRARHEATGFPGSIVRPAAIYGPDNNIFDMELPMFLRLLQHRPILVPHGELVVGSYGHVDDLCDAMIAVSRTPAAEGAVLNVSGESVDTNRYVRVLADVVGEEPDIVAVPDEMLPELSSTDAAPVFSHLFRARHHAALSLERAKELLGFAPRYNLRDGHQHTFAWFRAAGHTDLSGPLVDPVWKASWDFAAEAEIAERIRG